MAKYKKYNKNYKLFDYNDPGDKFYMVISGKVSCKIPFKK